MICPICECEFEPFSARHKYCSKRCACRAQAGVKKRTVECQECGVDVVTYDSRRRFCCTDCWNRWRARAENQRTGPVIKQCPVCGITFEALKAQRVYCSMSCAEAVRSDKRATRVCLVCGHPFIPRGSRQEICSGTCRADRDSAQRIPVGKVISCAGCQPFRVEVEVVRGVTLPRPVPVQA